MRARSVRSSAIAAAGSVGGFGLVLLVFELREPPQARRAASAVPSLDS